MWDETTGRRTRKRERDKLDMVQSMHIHDLVCSSLLLQYHIPKYPKNPWCSKDCSQSPTSIILTMEMDSQESQIDTYKIKHTHSAGEVQCDGANSQHFCLLRRQISCVPSTSCSRSFVSQLTLIYMYSMVNGKRREGMLPFHINSGVPVVVLWSIFKYFPWHTLPDTYICTERWTDKGRERVRKQHSCLCDEHFPQNN